MWVAGAVSTHELILINITQVPVNSLRDLRFLWSGKYKGWREGITGVKASLQHDDSLKEKKVTLFRNFDPRPMIILLLSYDGPLLILPTLSSQ